MKRLKRESMVRWFLVAVALVWNGVVCTSPAAAHEVQDVKNWEPGVSITVTAEIVGGDQTFGVQTPVYIYGNHKGTLRLDTSQSDLLERSAQVSCALYFTDTPNSVLSSDSFSLYVDRVQTVESKSGNTQWSGYSFLPGYTDITAETLGFGGTPWAQAVAKDTHRVTFQ